MLKPLHSQRGAAALMATVFLLLIMAVLGSIGLRLSGTDIRDTALQNDSVEALFLAESGLERAMQRLAAGTTCASLTPDAVFTLGRGDFEIKTAIVVGSVCRVQVLGRRLLGGNFPAQRLIEGDLVVSSSGWTVGQNGTIYKWDGSAWQDEIVGGFTNNASNTTLNGLSCITGNDCWAVGQRNSNRGTIVRLSGSTWSNVTSTFNNNLNAVHCLSSSSCWAVGDNGTIIYWDGSSWEDETGGGFTSNVPNRDLFGVFCVALNNCWAVGEAYNNDGLIVHWDGSSWEDETGGSLTFNNATPEVDLDAIHCVSATECWAVGDADDNRGTIVRWNSATSTWSNAVNNNSPDENLYGISCVSNIDCWAVGDNRNSHGTIVHWDGSNWNNVTAPANATLNEDLYDIFCLGNGSCYAVGRDGSATQRSGNNWPTVSTPASNRDLNAVSFPVGGGTTGLQQWREIIQ
jgi:hypothetical protein